MSSGGLFRVHPRRARPALLVRLASSPNRMPALHEPRIIVIEAAGQHVRHDRVLRGIGAERAVDELAAGADGVPVPVVDVVMLGVAPRDVAAEPALRPS